MNELSKVKFESDKRDFKFRLLERSYPQGLVNKIQAEVDFSSRNNALKYKPMTFKHILPFVTHHLQPKCTETQRDPNEELVFDR